MFGKLLKNKKSSSSTPKAEWMKVLDDNGELAKLCDKCKEVPNFPPVLFHLFEAHMKLSTLLSWAFEQETKTVENPHELFRGDTLATGLLFTTLYGDVGQDYVRDVLGSLVTDILFSQDESPIVHSGFLKLQKKKYWCYLKSNRMYYAKSEKSTPKGFVEMTIESSFQADPDAPLHFAILQSSRAWEFSAETSEEVAQWKKFLFQFKDGKRIEAKVDSPQYLKSIISFFKRLESSVPQCPLLLRDCFILMHEKILKQYPQSPEIFHTLIFLRFFCPTVINADKYRLGGSDRNSLALIQKSRGELITLSKVLIHIANNGVVNNQNAETSVTASIPKEAITECQDLLKSFVKKVVDKQTFEKAVKDFEATVEKNTSLIEENQKMAEIEMSLYLQDNNIIPREKDSSSLKASDSLDKRITKFEKAIKEIDFKLEKKHKDSDLVVYFNKAPPYSNWKFTVSIPVPCDKFFLIWWSDFQMLIPLFDPALQKLQLLSSSNTSQEYFIQSDGRFPISERDFVFVHTVSQKQYDKKKVLKKANIYVMNTVHKNAQPQKNVTRGNLNIAMNIEASESKEFTTNITMVMQLDIKGTLPSIVQSMIQSQLKKSFEDLSYYMECRIFGKSEKQKQSMLKSYLHPKKEVYEEDDDDGDLF